MGRKDKFKCLWELAVKNRAKGIHYRDCVCLPCQALLARCPCSFCIEKRTRFSGKSVNDRDFSRYPNLQQLIELEEHG